MTKIILFVLLASSICFQIQPHSLQNSTNNNKNQDPNIHKTIIDHSLQYLCHHHKAYDPLKKSCVETCSPPLTPNSNNLCQCPSGKYLDPKTQTCAGSCPALKFANQFGICIGCEEFEDPLLAPQQCSAISPRRLLQAVTCLDNQYLITDLNTCVDICPHPYVTGVKVCQLCKVGCYDPISRSCTQFCTDPLRQSATQLLCQCPNSQYYSDFTQSCAASCPPFSNPLKLIRTCDFCSEGEYYNQYQSVCVQSCPSYLIKTVDSRCQCPNSGNYYDLATTSCVSTCPASFYPDQNKVCTLCYGKKIDPYSGPNSCLQQCPNYMLEVQQTCICPPNQQFLLTSPSSCVSTCPINYTPNPSKICTLCLNQFFNPFASPPTCVVQCPSYLRTSQNICLCPSGTSFLSSEQSCVEFCPIPLSPDDDGICNPCSQGQFYDFLNDQPSCLQSCTPPTASLNNGLCGCQNDLVYDGSVKSCVEVCSSSLVVNKYGFCTQSCSEGEVVYNRYCVQECPGSWVDKQGTCTLQCSSNQYIQGLECRDCPSNMRVSGNKCVSSIHLGVCAVLGILLLLLIN